MCYLLMLCADIPTAPPKLTEMRVWPLATSVEVSWKPPNHGTVRGYQVGYGISIPDVYSVDVNASVLHYIIENLGKSASNVFKKCYFLQCMCAVAEIYALGSCKTFSCLIKQFSELMMVTEDKKNGW